MLSETRAREERFLAKVREFIDEAAELREWKRKVTEGLTLVSTISAEKLVEMVNQRFMEGEEAIAELKAQQKETLERERMVESLFKVRRNIKQLQQEATERLHTIAEGSDEWISVNNAILIYHSAQQDIKMQLNGLARPVFDERWCELCDFLEISAESTAEDARSAILGIVADELEPVVIEKVRFERNAANWKKIAEDAIAAIREINENAGMRW